MAGSLGEVPEVEEYFLPSLKLIPHEPILEKTKFARQITVERD
jgi:hypothetical protein